MQKYIDLSALGIDEARKQTEGNYYGVLYIPKSDSLVDLSKGIAFYSEDTPSLNLLSSIENKLEKKVESIFRETYDSKGLKRPEYRGELPEGNNGLGLLLLGITGDMVLPILVYKSLR